MPANVEDLAALVARLELVAARLEGAASGGQSAVSAEAASAAVAAFDGLVSGPLRQFVDISKQIGKKERVVCFCQCFGSAVVICGSGFSILDECGSGSGFW
jgi:hypothetical protein